MVRKPLFLSVILFLLGFSAIAQTYHPFRTNDAMWRESEGGYQSSTCQKYQYIITGDTVIGGISYHKLRKTGASYPYTSTTCNFDVPTGPIDEYVGAFRNDSSAQKVYFVPSGHSSDTLLYDFDLSVGDTLPDTYFYSLGGPYVVYTIDTVSFDGEDHEIYRLDSSCGRVGPLNGYAWIEGVGSNKGLLGTYGCPFERYISSECYSENGVPRLSSHSTLCDTVTSLRDSKRKIGKVTSVKAFPNPTKGMVHLEIPTDRSEGRAILRNAYGERVGEKRITSGGRISFKLDGPSGLYLIEIWGEGERERTLRIMKK